LLSGPSTRAIASSIFVFHFEQYSSQKFSTSIIPGSFAKTSKSLIAFSAASIIYIVTITHIYLQ
ncbi:hypothetical protein, partial [Enterobacter cloacae]|uniref:hypothetical protein n=1 Tax=Enterobacter cloacae TaxID=550 RepID=UPI001CA472DD